MNENGKRFTVEEMEAIKEDIKFRTLVIERQKIISEKIEVLFTKIDSTEKACKEYTNRAVTWCLGIPGTIFILLKVFEISIK